MATAIRLEALDALPRVDPAGAAMGEHVMGLLEAAGVDAARVEQAPAGLWFACEQGVRFRVAGGPPIDAERIEGAIALLDRADPLLTRVETALALALDPLAVDDCAGTPGIALALAAEGVAATIFLPRDHPARRSWETKAAALQPDSDRRPSLVRILITGPRIPIAEAGALAAGDLVLIAARPAALLEPIEGSGIGGQIDLASGSFTPHPEGNPMAAEPAASRDFAVPLSIRLPDRATSAASLAALRPGTALPLGPLTDGMPVELLVAGRLLARGELVQLGDRFAVLIEERAAIDDLASAEPLDVGIEANAAEARA